MLLAGCLCGFLFHRTALHHGPAKSTKAVCCSSVALCSRNRQIEFHESILFPPPPVFHQGDIWESFRMTEMIFGLRGKDTRTILNPEMIHWVRNFKSLSNLTTLLITRETADWTIGPRELSAFHAEHSKFFSFVQDKISAEQANVAVPV
jgi:hypothetical protein